MGVEEKLEVHKARVDVVVIIAKVDELSGGSSHCESGEAPLQNGGFAGDAMGSGVIELIEKKSKRRGKMEESDRCLGVREREVMIVIGKKKESM